MDDFSFIVNNLIKEDDESVAFHALSSSCLVIFGFLPVCSDTDGVCEPAHHGLACCNHRSALLIALNDWSYALNGGYDIPDHWICLFVIVSFAQLLRLTVSFH